MILVYINNKELYLKDSITIIQAAKLVNVDIPRFCFHEKLSIAGNCRMCLVEVEKIAKPVASCAVQVVDNMHVFTNSILVKKAREAVLELLLINHPLDCPICDQGGECDLQDQALYFGNDRGRFYDVKRSVEDKNLGLIVKTIMTRCIHCTRCVRFLNEVADNTSLGMVGRGKKSEISPYFLSSTKFKPTSKINNILSNELSGNIIDLCPVGALTSKPYSFKARPWELKSIETLDLCDSLGSNIRIDTRGTKIMRILPKINEELNEEWITDKTRFNFDGYFNQRLDCCYYVLNTIYTYDLLDSFNLSEINKSVKIKTIKIMISCNWEIAFRIFEEDCILRNNIIGDMQIILGSETGLETLYLLREFHNLYNMSGFFPFENKLSNQVSTNIDCDTNYLLLKSPKDLEDIDLCLLVGINLKIENPLLNVRLRKAFSKNCIIACIGPSILDDNLYLNNNICKLDNSYTTFYKILNGKHSFCSTILNSKNPLIVVSSFINIDNYFSNYFTIVNFNSISANYLGLCELGYYNYNKNRNLYFLSNCDNIKTNKTFKNQINNYLTNYKTNSYLIYQGSHADYSYKYANLIFPTKIFAEQSQFFLNLTHNIQYTSDLALSFPFNRKKLYIPKTSWKIINNLLFFLNPFVIYYNDLLTIKQKIDDLSLNFKNIEKNKKFSYLLSNKDLNFIKKHNFNSFINNIHSNFYLTNSISRSSLLMQKLALQNSYYKL